MRASFRRAARWGGAAACVLALVAGAAVVTRLGGGKGRSATSVAESPGKDAATGGDPDRPAGAPAGKWRLARTAAEAPSTGEDASALLATPYLKGYRPASASALIPTYDAARAWDGVNLYVSGHACEAFLVDMRGRLLHRWRYDLRRLWPDLFAGAEAERMQAIEYWRRAALLPDGGLLAIYEGLGIVRLDRDSRLVWAHRGGIHHDLEVDPDGTIWTLDRRRRAIPGVAGGREILEDLVTVLAPDGTVRRQISIVEALLRSPHAALLADLPPGIDVLHTNTLERLREPVLADRLPALRPGNLLLSLLTKDTVVALDPATETVTWAMGGGLWRRQHQPTLLANGHLLVFDNTGLDFRTRVVEVDPLTQTLAWSWPQPPDAARLQSKTLGSCQRLPNGNTLITESENGRAIEVDAAGEIVWELRSPHRAGEKGELVATLFEVVRLPADQPWLARGPSAASRRSGAAGRN